jgi:hypothetical protein
MLTVTGRISGVKMLSFEPTNNRFKDAFGTVVFGSPVQVKPDSLGLFSVKLYSNAELVPVNGQPWRWICTEVKEARDKVWRHKLFRFAFTSDPGDYSYAVIRPLEGLP